MRQARTTGLAGLKDRGHRRHRRGQLFGCLVIFLSVMLNAGASQAFVYQDRISLSKGLAHYAMGQMYDLLGLTHQAVFEYEKSLQFDESSYLTHLRLGSNYARLNLFNDAVNQLNLVNTYNPEDLQSHYLLALIYSTQKDYDKAAKEYELILTRFSREEPENIEIYGYLGQLYYSQKKYEQAAQQFERILELEPKNADVMYLLGSLYLDIDKKTNAIELLKRSIETDPDHDGSLNTLGYTYAEEGKNLDEALNLVQRAIKIDPENGAYLDSLGWVYYKRGDYDQAIDALNRAVELMEDPVIYTHLADVYFSMNKIDEAKKYWELSLKLHPDQKDVRQKLNELKNTQASGPVTKSF